VLGAALGKEKRRRKETNVRKREGGK